MITQTATIKDGKIVLPRKFRKSWKKAEVFIEVLGDTISIKRLTKPSSSLIEMMDEFQQAARQTKLSRKDAEEAIKEVRKKLYK